MKKASNKIYRYYFNNPKGITLIALIITIILLLILAGVAISLTLGENGIINIAKQAVEKNSEQEAKEKLELLLIDLQSKKYIDQTYDENEYINNYFKGHEISLKEDIATVNGWCFMIDRKKLEIVNSLGKSENFNINNIIGQQLSVDFRNTLNGYTPTVGSAITDATLGLVPKDYISDGSGWTNCYYEKAINTPFDLSQKFEIEINSKQITSTAYQMGGMIINLEKKNQSGVYDNVMQMVAVDCWEINQSIEFVLVKNNQRLYSNQTVGSNYMVKIIGDGTNINFYLNDQCVATTNQEKDISIDKVSIIFQKYPNHEQLDENSLESLYFGDIRN